MATFRLRMMMRVFMTTLLPPARSSGFKDRQNIKVSRKHAALTDTRRHAGVARLTLLQLLRLGARGTAGGGKVHKHDQEDCSDDRDDDLAHQPKLGEIEQGEIADDKVGDDSPNHANYQVAQNTEASAPQSAACQASGDGARNDL